MKLQINGEQVVIPDTVSYVADLLHHYGLGNKVVVVEVNASILQKEEHAITRLTDGDRIEIVHFVGGG